MESKSVFFRGSNVSWLRKGEKALDFLDSAESFGMTSADENSFVNVFFPWIPIVLYMSFYRYLKGATNPKSCHSCSCKADFAMDPTSRLAIQQNVVGEFGCFEERCDR